MASYSGDLEGDRGNIALKEAYWGCGSFYITVVVSHGEVEIRLVEGLRTVVKTEVSTSYVNRFYPSRKTARYRLRLKTCKVNTKFHYDITTT